MSDEPKFGPNAGQWAAIALVGVIAIGAQISREWSKSPEQRREDKRKRQADRRRRRADDENRRRESRERGEVDMMRRKALLAYFETGPGKARYEARCMTVYRADQPYPDATFAYQESGYRQTKFVISSASAGLELRAHFDSADRAGSIRLSREGKEIWSMTAVFHNGVISPYYGGRDYNPDGASLAANLLAASDCRFHAIKLVHPDADDIKSEIWSEYMGSNPKLAKKLRWDPERPLH